MSPAPSSGHENPTITQMYTVRHYKRTDIKQRTASENRERQCAKAKVSQSRAMGKNCVARDRMGWQTICIYTHSTSANSTRPSSLYSVAARVKRVQPVRYNRSPQLPVSIYIIRFCSPSLLSFAFCVQQYSAHSAVVVTPSSPILCSVCKRLSPHDMSVGLPARWQRTKRR
jgi:hypothetical protein